MAYNPIPAVEVDELWDEDDFNLVGADFAANIPDIFTAAGQIGAASGANALAAVDVGANFTALTAKSAETGGIGWEGGVVQLGMIIIWSGAVGSIPSGWSLCNGSNGTPDLRDKFIVGAGDTYDPGDTGGADVDLAHSHTPNASATDSDDWDHSHTQGATGSEASHFHEDAGTTGTPSSTATWNTGTGSNIATGTHTHAWGLTGAGTSHSHTNPDTDIETPDHSHIIGATSSALSDGYLPPYYALCYIMRTS